MKQVRGIWLPDEDTHFESHLLKNPWFHDKGTYQYSKLQAALPLVKRYNMAFDVGAHVGTWSRVLYHHFARVVAFEPVSEHVECLRLNAPNVEVKPVAVGAHTGKCSLTITPANSGNCRVNGDGQTHMIALDSLDCEHLDFLKIDVEGYEVEVLRGGEGIIRRTCPVIVIEQKPGNAEQFGFTQFQALDLLLSWGFTVAWHKSGDYCLV